MTICAPPGLGERGSVDKEDAMFENNADLMICENRIFLWIMTKYFGDGRTITKSFRFFYLKSKKNDGVIL